VNPSDRIK